MRKLVIFLGNENWGKILHGNAFQAWIMNWNDYIGITFLWNVFSKILEELFNDKLEEIIKRMNEIQTILFESLRVVAMRNKVQVEIDFLFNV